MPAAAEPHVLSPEPLEQAAVPPSRDDLGHLSVEPLAETMGSGGASTRQREEPEGAANAEILGVDPWAHAFAECAPLPAVTLDPPYPLVMNTQVLYFLDRFTGSRREVVTLWLSRSGRYLGMIRDVFRDHGLPEDLAFVAMIESGYNPLAVSRAGAKGLWQFMAGTARRYGLRVDQWVDERFDPEKSTTAAAAYLRDLHQQFGSWALAKAAYNAGEVKVHRAIKAIGSTDFWALARSRFLRQETKDFVPAIQAATVIGRDPERYGFTADDLPIPAVEIVTVPPGTKLRALSDTTGIPLETLRGLNPVLIRGATPPGAPYELKVPASGTDRVRAALARPKPSHATSRAPLRVASAALARETGVGLHVVQSGDTVTSIAKRYGVTIADILRWNGLDRTERIYPGDRLRVTDVRLSAEHHGRTGVR